MKRVRMNASANHDPGYENTLKAIQDLIDFSQAIHDNFLEDWENNPMDACNTVAYSVDYSLRQVAKHVSSTARRAAEEQEQLYG